MALVLKQKAELAKVSAGVKLGTPLGAGGNGVVYAGEHAQFGPVAVKFMLNDDSKRFGRFCDEVKVVTGRLKDSPHVLPILEAILTDPKIGVPYYIMPAAEQITRVLKGVAWDAKLFALAELAEGLAELHRNEVAHRDIKPENLFFFAGTYRYGDFGIASFPENLGLTEKNEPMGPWAYMAIEMLSNPLTADEYMADIYSFAKTTWAILTEEKVPFAGQYSSSGDEALSSRATANGLVIEPLELLLRDSTASNPQSRPTALEFARRMHDIMRIQSDFRSGNTAQWAAAELDAVSGPGVVRAKWETVEFIANALAVLSRRDGLNHFFFPEGGGQQISRVSVCENGAMLWLEVPYGQSLVVKPRSLTLERFVGRPELGYAVLETADVEPLGVGKSYSTGISELLRQVGDCDYLTDDSDDDEPMNRAAGPPCERRFKGGTFIFAPTGGIYNTIDDYMGTNQALGVDGLRQLFQGYCDQLNVALKMTCLQLVPFPRLQTSSRVPRQELVLQYLEMPMLQKLIELDDALLSERRSSQESFRTNRLDLVLAEPTAAELRGQGLLGTMTPGQVAECLALLNVGRNVRAPEEMRENTAENVQSKLDTNNVLSKFGRSYLRKAMARYGLSILMPPDV